MPGGVLRLREGPRAGDSTLWSSDSPWSSDPEDAFDQDGGYLPAFDLARGADAAGLDRDTCPPDALVVMDGGVSDAAGRPSKRRKAALLAGSALAVMVAVAVVSTGLMAGFWLPPGGRPEGLGSCDGMLLSSAFDPRIRTSPECAGKKDDFEFRCSAGCPGGSFSLGEHFYKSLQLR